MILTFQSHFDKINSYLVFLIWPDGIDFYNFKTCCYDDLILWANTAQKMKFSMEEFFSKCDKIRGKLQIWSHLLKNSLIENFIFLQCNLHIRACWLKKSCLMEQKQPFRGFLKRGDFLKEVFFWNSGIGVVL